MANEETILNTISDCINLEVCKEDRFDALGLDSLDIIDLLMECELTFNVSIDNKDFMKMQTVGELVKLIQELDMQDYFESTQADLQPDYD